MLKGLSNCLLGVTSLALKLVGECNAYMQGVAGNLAALREATAALQDGRIDAAIVVGAGSELDALALSGLVQAGSSAPTARTLCCRLTFGAPVALPGRARQHWCCAGAKTCRPALRRASPT